MKVAAITPVNKVANLPDLPILGQRQARQLGDPPRLQHHRRREGNVRHDRRESSSALGDFCRAVGASGPVGPGTFAT
jgi:hypothetical protein